MITKVASLSASDFRLLLMRFSSHWHTLSYMSESFVVRLSTTLSREVRRDMRKKAALMIDKFASDHSMHLRLCSDSDGEDMVQLISLAQSTLYFSICDGSSFFDAHRNVSTDFTRVCRLAFVLRSKRS